MNYPRPRASMIRHAAFFYDHGWMLATSGNLSSRVSSGFTITASARHKGELSAHDFSVCDEEGHPLPGQPKPSAEASIHAVLYRLLPDVGAVYHVHHPGAALCAARDARLGASRFEHLEMLKALGFEAEDGPVDIPIFTNHPRVADIAHEVASYLRRATAPAPPAVNILGHGFYAWGRDVDAARRHIEALCYLYDYSWRAEGQMPPARLPA